jgi:hypothetical protein
MIQNTALRTHCRPLTNSLLNQGEAETGDVAWVHLLASNLFNLFDPRLDDLIPDLGRLLVVRILENNLLRRRPLLRC